MHVSRMRHAVRESAAAVYRSVRDDGLAAAGKETIVFAACRARQRALHAAGLVFAASAATLLRGWIYLRLRENLSLMKKVRMSPPLGLTFSTVRVPEIADGFSRAKLK